MIELESSIGEEDATSTPYFEDVFEGMCQHLDIAQSRIPKANRKSFASSVAAPVVRAKSALLARRPTKLVRLAEEPSEQEDAWGNANRLARHIGLHRQSDLQVAIEGRLHTVVLTKLHGADEVQLAQLHRFETEVQVLAQELVLDSERFTSDQHDALNDLYRSTLAGLFASHRADVIAQVDMHSLQFHSAATISESYRQALQPLKQCYSYTSSHGIDSNAWVLLALTGLALYVPNYPHDPALRPMIERSLYNDEKSGLLQSLQTLRQFQVSFTGQDTSFRIRRTENTIREMGEEPPVPAIVRPSTSELDALQGEFSNLLSVIHPLSKGTMSIKEAAQDRTLKQNISHIIRRLTEGYRSYDDITDPAVGFLVCLSIGLSLGAKEQEEEGQISRSLAYLSKNTPLFGFHEYHVRNINSQDLIQHCEEQLAQNNHAVDLRWHALHSLVVIKTVDPPCLAGETPRRLIHDIFSSFYGDWKTQLLKDQQEEAKNSSLYTYRGEEEDNDEEDRSLFPDYEEEESPQTHQSSTSRDHAIRLARMHALLFLDAGNSTDGIKKLLEWCAGEMSRVTEGKAYGTKHDFALPAIYFALENKVDALASSGQGRSYNFYFDANLPEAKRMMALIHRIQLRYRQIRNVWPEHATLSEVLRTCDEALEFRHVDPIAKLITKLEKLHGYMYEWQRVASKEFSTAPLFDDLTSLLVSWRQLELTTWARLFDMEIEKCHDGASSWFFVAYETIIAAADSIDQENDMKLFAKDLLKTLEGFFYATTLGQYEQRINLLRQLHAHILMRTTDSALFRPLATALENFIAYFSRLQKPVRESLTKGRQTLEKEVNNVIKLASWKDTNIEALKQSAKTSHRKLSKLVRKFRALLNQPVSGIVKAGFPEESASIASVDMEKVITAVPPTALELSNNTIPAWEDRPTRFKNLAVTVPLMSKMTIPGADVLDAATYIESFIVDLESQAVELQKATPSTLTEENKMTVQHLKTRKRKLYADTMKELRQMGVKANLSTDLLARQDELSTVLTSLPAIEAKHGSSSELFLYKALSIMDQVRDVAREHHGDLTSNDVMRSIGYLEGLLHASTRQRALLSKASKTLLQFQSPLKRVKQLSDLHDQTVIRVPEQQCTTMGMVKPQASWLSTMLDAGAEVVAAQSKLGKTNEISDLRQEMKDWSVKLRSSVDAFDALPVISSNVWTEAHTELDQSIRTQLDDVRATFNTWVERFPISRTVLQHLQSFFFQYPDFTPQVTSGEQCITIGAHSKEILATLDLVLGSMQDVETALKTLPTSTDDATWLIKEEEALSDAIKAIHASQIGEAIDKLLDNFGIFAEDTKMQAVTALFATVQPVLDQYLASQESLVARFAALHTSTAKLLHRLCKSFIQVGTQGFCQPAEKSSDQDEKTKDEKLEEGTGLGAGEGAEDISKDIEDDEDLEDLAQEKGEREGSIEEEEDAVDMGEQDMEGETGETAEKEDKGDEDGEEGDDDVQSEVSSVDDLGPSAVDEKMWDEGGKEDDLKDRDTKEDVGTENQNEQVASEQKEKPEDEKKNEKEEKEGGEEDEEMEMEGEDQEENVGMGETEQMDPHAKEEETLDLPDELNIDGNEDDDKGDEGQDDMDMDDDLPEEEADADTAPQPDMVDEEVGPEHEGEEEKDTTGHVEDEEMKEDEEQEQEGEEPMDDDAVPLPDQNMPEEESRDTKDDMQADPNAEAGAGADANEEAHKNQQEQTSASAANRDEGAEGESAEQQQETTAEDGTLGQTAQPDAGGRGEQPQESPETQSFKKLGDVLERWYNQQKQISEARQEKDETQVQQIDKEIDMANADFEHLQDEEEQADTQALGTATEEQAKALDHDMAMAVDEEDKTAARPEDNEELPDTNQDVDMQDSEPPKQEEQEPQQQSAPDGRPQAFVGEQKPFADDEDAAMDDALPLEDDVSDTSSVDEVETKLDLVHLEDNSGLTPESARALWLSHESSTHSLSQQLTESLRLILAPTLATKLRGDFRTGKRLNLKRIIPYIASSYKRDKIWLRRSLPSKRSYQVMIALDDSKSMAESGASNLALKTLTLVARSMAMLEVGEVAVTGFGDRINVAHDFDKPFTSEAGVRVFEQFGFGQQKTDVRGLVHKSLDLFSEARRKGSSSAGEDLWQLMLIVSDGICDSHAEIQRLIRRAQEERVMIVFVIIDSAAAAPAAKQDEAGVTGEKAEEKKGIMDLQSVEISSEGKVVRWKYMERFPFRYFLVVRDVRELPGVLSGALRQWFGEVVGSV